MRIINFGLTSTAVFLASLLLLPLIAPTMMLHTIMAVVVVVVVVPPVVRANEDDNAQSSSLISKWPDFVAWYRSHGGKVDDRITIGYEPNTTIRGTIATSYIPANTVLMHTPHNLILSSHTEDTCEDIRFVLNEMSKGQHSIWYTYFTFDDSSGSRVPSHWNREYSSSSSIDEVNEYHHYFKDGRAIQELQGLPPSGYTHQNIDWGNEACLRQSSSSPPRQQRPPSSPTEEGGGDDEEEEDKTEIEQYWKAAHIYHTRASDIGLIPLYDLMNHHNGKINTRLHRDGDGGLYVTALVDIHEGEPIYNTYARNGWESSIDVFNGYGFVEDYPQLWRWDGEELDINNNIVVDDDSEDNEGEYDVSTEREGGEEEENEDTSSTVYQGSRGHISNRYVIPISDHFEPNHPLYEILIISPTLGALSPTKQLVSVLGNEQRSLEEWSKHIRSHHGIVRSSHVHALHDAALHLLNGLPTTLEEDEKILKLEKKHLERLRGMGREDRNKKDVIQAIEYRMAFKKALRLAVEVAEMEGAFYMDDMEEL